MASPEIRVYDRNLREVFWPGDREFAARVARLCVLYEDLRVEYGGARHMEGIEPLDGLSRQYRQMYFLRRSLVTLVEFCGALQKVNENTPWREWVSRQDKPTRNRWRRAIRYFASKQPEWKAVRDALGGHYLESSAKYAVENLGTGATGKLEIELDHEQQTGNAKLHFCTELVAVVMRKTMPNQNQTPDEFAAFIEALFESVTTGWRYAVEAVNVVIADYLVPRFERGTAPAHRVDQRSS